ncbi:MAG: M23 family metallopeptidase [Acidobacteria bacterium]|nr:M23 family metallopeptidase [Acidobacteriota bacterium]
MADVAMMMPAGLLLAAAFLVPSEVRQGRVIRVSGPATGEGLSAEFGTKTFPIFVHGGVAQAMIPVSVDQKPGQYEVIFRQGKTELQRSTLTVRKTAFRTQNIQATKQMKELRPIPGEVERMQALAATVTPVRLFEDAFVPPVSGCQNSPFGVQRLHNGKPTGAYHRGVDQRGAQGTPIRAAASGKVVVAQPDFQVRGGTVGIDHGHGLTSHYLHMSRVIAREGQGVKQGEIIGYVGSTGFATAAHLHWGTYVHGTPIDPNDFVALRPCAAPQRKKGR